MEVPNTMIRPSSETIPLPFVEPGDDLLRVGEEPPSPTDYCVALLRDGKLQKLILPSNGVPLTMCASDGTHGATPRIVSVTGSDAEVELPKTTSNMDIIAAVLVWIAKSCLAVMYNTRNCTHEFIPC